MLWKQLLRSMWRNKKAYIACVVLLALGTALFVAFNFLFLNLSTAQQALYEENRFGDGFAVVESIPLSSVRRAAAVEGIRQMDATIVVDARLMREDSQRVITLRISSFALDDPERLNNFILVSGTLPGDDGILLGEAFAAANGYKIGDTVPLALGGQKLSPVVTGLAQSPEYVYAIPDTGQLLPDNEAFGFGYMTQTRLGIATGLSGSATNLSFLLEDGVSWKQVQYELEDVLKPYGLKTLIERANQPSHSMLQMEIDSIGTMSTSFPMLFIMMSVVILYIMLKRIVEQERDQIGTLKAFGFSGEYILTHYLSYGVITGAAGGVLGVLLGVIITTPLTELMLIFFSLPAIRVPPKISLLLISVLISVVAGALGALMGTRSILKLRVVDAMRPPAPPGVKFDLVGRIPFLHGVLNSFGFMAVRNITRNKFRSVFVVIGVSFAFAMSAFMASYFDMFDAIMLDQFNKVERYNLKVSLKVPQPWGETAETAHRLPGVKQAEPVLEVPLELRSGHLKESVMLTALPESSDLYHIYDNDRKADLAVPQGGMVLADTLAKRLGVQRGSLVMATTPYTGDTEYPLVVMDIVHTNLGVGAYMQAEDLWKLLEIPPTATGLMLRAQDPVQIKTHLLEAKNVSAVTDKDDMARIYTDMLESYGAMLYMMQFAGLGIAFAIITNTSTISLSERKREYATMRVLGMHPTEIGQVVSFEYYFLTVLAVPFGIVLTRMLKQAMAGMIESDMFSMPLDTPPVCFVVAFGICLLAVALSNRSAKKKIAGFDMVEVLKERE